jgi:hypothetical protein
MAKFTLNPAFTDANGSMGRIVLYKRNGVLCARKHVIPVNPDTPEQRSNRNRFALAVKAWRETPADEKKKWNLKAKRKGKTGYNYFLSQYMKSTTKLYIRD